MELMKEINTLANHYVPEVKEDVRTERMIKSMTPPKKDKKKETDVTPSSKLSIKNIFHKNK